MEKTLLILTESGMHKFVTHDGLNAFHYVPSPESGAWVLLACFKMTLTEFYFSAFGAGVWHAKFFEGKIVYHELLRELETEEDRG